MVLLLVYLLVSLEVAVRWQLGLESWRLNWAGRSKMASPPTCVVPRCASTWLISALCVSSSRAFLLMIRVVGVLPCGWLPRAPRCTLFSLPKASVQHWHTSSAAFCREGRHRTRPESGWMQERRQGGHGFLDGHVTDQPSQKCRENMQGHRAHKRETASARPK